MHGCTVPNTLYRMAAALLAAVFYELAVGLRDLYRGDPAIGVARVATGLFVALLSSPLVYLIQFCLWRST